MKTSETPTVSSESQTIIDRLAEGSFEIPLLPQVANQVMTICSNADCDIRELTETIKNDPALMAHVLRMANSALFCPDVPIVSLQLAVNRLGLSTLRDLAIAAACKGTVFRPGRSKKVVQRLFKRAMARGAFAQEIARRKRRNVEVAFLAGLMREIGSPVVVFELEESDISEAQLLQVVDQFKFKVGVTVLESWGLPDKVCRSVRFAEDPDGADDLFELIHTTALADYFAARALDPECNYDSIVLEDACIALNLYAEDIAFIEEQSERVVALAEALG